MEPIYYETNQRNIPVIRHNRNEMNFSLVGLGAFKFKYLLRRGDGSEACLALPASGCPRHHHERAASHTAWRTDKHLVRKSNYMYVKDIFYIGK